MSLDVQYSEIPAQLVESAVLLGEFYLCLNLEAEVVLDETGVLKSLDLMRIRT